MFTSRAEYRLLLREDNADLRLTAKGRELGLVGEHRWSVFSEKAKAIQTAQTQLHNTWVRVEHNEQLNAIIEKPLQQDCRAHDFLKRPEINYQQLQAIAELDLPQLPEDIAEQVEIQCKYAGYIERQQVEIERLRKHEEMPLQSGFDYHQITGLSSEVIQKLNQIQPRSMAQASRISGVTPAALSLLLVHLKKHRGACA